MRILTARPHRLLAACITRIGERTEAGEACMFLVPSQYTLQAELEIMDRLALEGTFVIDVLSPGRLQSRVFERAGAPQRVIFDERGKRMVLSELIAQEKEQLTIYRSAAESGTQGFAAKISSMIADFKRSGKTAQEILLAAEQMEDGPAKSKLQDAGRIYSAYEQRMAEELADAEDVSREMLARMERSGVLKGKHLFVYGFDMITPTFAAELVHMAKLAASLTLAVETDENAAPDGRLFAPVNLSLDRLAAAARGAGVAIERERIVCEVQERDDLRAMEHALYGIGVKPYEKDPEHISLRAASTMRAEVHSTAAAIRRMCRDGMSTQDAAIVYPKGSGYAPLLMGILPMYGIPAYAAEKRLAAAHPLSRLVLSALACASGGMRTADVIECIQTGFMGLTQEEMDALCAYAEGVDLRSEAWKRPFTYMKDDDEQALAQLNAAREKAAEPLLRFMAALRRAKDADGTIAAVIALLDELNAYDKLDDMRAALMEAGLAPEAEDCTQVWNQLMDTLDQLHTLLGGRRATAELAGKLLQEGLCALELAAQVPAEEVQRMAAAVDKDDVCNMQYTSGTTGFPKGVMLTHYNVVNNGKFIGDQMELSTADRMMIQVPMFHCFGMVLSMTASMTHGTTMLPLPYFSPKPALACVHNEHITAFNGVPTMFIAMMQHPTLRRRISPICVSALWQAPTAPPT